MKTPMICDIETYPNYNLFAFMKNGKVTTFESWHKFTKKQCKKITKLMENNLIVTYNGNNYDIPLINYAVKKNASVNQMYMASKAIIEDRLKPFALYRKMNLAFEDRLKINHIDLKEPAPAVMISLKLYGSRLNSKVLWDLPYDPHTPLTIKQAETIVEYCENDLQITLDLFNGIKDRLELREQMSEQYDIDLRSKSDAQIAEAVMKSELAKDGIHAERPHLDDGYNCYYKPPKYIKFKTKQLKQLFKKIKNQNFLLDNGGSVKIPAALSQEVITIGNTSYNIGIGGLHSMEKSLAVTKGKMMNADYSSYYPFIILKNGYYPLHLGKKFLDVYKNIVTTRLKAKAEGDTLVANSLKITINGSFGKYGSKWSVLYSPDLLLQVTLTGQLTLLMLIEKLESKGISVVSANTDGLEMNIHTKKQEKKARKIIKKFDEVTGYEMEIGEYKALFARDVNNYVAKYDGYVKAKGVYADPLDKNNYLKKNSQTPIVFESVREFINNGTPIKKTINKCDDVTKFLSSRNVKGGGVFGVDLEYVPVIVSEIQWVGERLAAVPLPERWEASLKRNKRVTKSILEEIEKNEAQYIKENGQYLGKVVRWYYSTKGSAIYYKSNGNKVPKTDGAMPMMTLKKKIPKDLDYTWYYNEAEQMLLDLGIGLGLVEKDFFKTS